MHKPKIIFFSNFHSFPDYPERFIKPVKYDIVWWPWRDLEEHIFCMMAAQLNEWENLLKGLLDTVGETVCAHTSKYNFIF
jgi:hypothetical protein